MALTAGKQVGAVGLQEAVELIDLPTTLLPRCKDPEAVEVLKDHPEGICGLGFGCMAVGIFERKLAELLPYRELRALLNTSKFEGRGLQASPVRPRRRFPMGPIDMVD